MEIHIEQVGSLKITDDAAGIQSLLEAQESIEYSVLSIDPSAQSYTRDDWDGAAAMSAAPTPSDGDDARQELRDMVLLHPTEPDDATDNKSNYKLPFRSSPDGPVNLNAVTAILAAINGARGGVEGVGRDTLQSAHNAAVRMGVEGGLYEDQSEAPDFAPGSAADPSTADVSADAGAKVTGRFTVEAAANAADDGSGSTLTGVVWAAGDHELYVDGDPTPVHVPPESIPDTFQKVQKRVKAGNPPTIGLDHGDNLHRDAVPVAAELDVLTIGKARDFALSENERKIVLTDSELTEERAVEATKSGELDRFDFSIVGPLRIVSIPSWVFSLSRPCSSPRRRIPSVRFNPVLGFLPVSTRRDRRDSPN